MASVAGIKKAPRKRKATLSLYTPPSDSSEIDAVDSAFPISAAEQGSQITTVIVGTGSNSQTFKIHKNLLCKASKCFDGALNDGFVESNGILNLRNDHPVTFEVLYQWLYSGFIREASFYTKSSQNISPALLWIRVYKFADCRLIEPLQETAYKKFCNCFKVLTLGFLSSQLIDELYDDTGSEHLQRYLIHHAAYHMGRPMIKGVDQGNWKATLDKHSEFKAATGAKVIDARLSGEFMHPSVLKEFQSFKAGQSVDIKDIVPVGSQAI